MKSQESITQTPGNSPLLKMKKFPEDYHPKGCGFWFKLSRGLDAGKKMFFRDSIHGEGTPKDTLVFVHGNPECSYTYRKVIKTLIASTKTPIRIVAMDHIGFGLSDQATYEMVCMDHAENLLELIRTLDLRDVTLIIHDWGGPTGIGAFLKEPKRVKNLVVLNSTVFPIPEKGMTYENYPGNWVYWAKGPKIIPKSFWGCFAAFVIFVEPMKPRKLFRKMVFSLIAKKVGIYRKKGKIAQKIYKKQFNSKSNVFSSKRLVFQTLKWGHGNKYEEPELGERDTTTFYQFIQDNIKKAWGPSGQNIGVQAIIGRWDPLGKKEVLDQWIEHLPQLQEHIKLFSNTGHFIEEKQPKEIANAILELQT